jgi:hypothetical protein
MTTSPFNKLSEGIARLSNKDSRSDLDLKRNRKSLLRLCLFEFETSKA